MKLLLLILSIALVSVGLFAALAVPYLPMYTGRLWVLAGLFLVLGTGVLLCRLPLRYLFLVIPLGALMAHAGISRIWPEGLPPVTVAAAVVVDPAAPQLVPVVIEEGPEAVKGQSLELPRGWQVSIFASDLGKARLLSQGPDGQLLVSIPDRGQILALADIDHDGRADATTLIADQLASVHGLALAGGTLWAAETDRLLRLELNEAGRAANVTEQSRDLPSGGGHWTRTLAVTADGTLYLSAGSSCNACLEADSRRATIMTFNASSNSGSIFAYGLRNSVGLAIHPLTGELWASDNGRDMLGDDLPPDEINRIVAGQDYGWPYCYGNRVPDPQLGSAQRCAETVPAAVELPAHSAPLGISFVKAALFDFPADHLLLVAYHGSWNRSVPTGYKLVAIPFTAGRPSGQPFDLMRGWLHAGEVWGRPVAPLRGADGALYLSDDLQGIIYRFWKDQPAGS
jgi:glucose/arabinose dehydrogenase